MKKLAMFFILVVMFGVFAPLSQAQEYRYGYGQYGWRRPAPQVRRAAWVRHERRERARFIRHERRERQAFRRHEWRERQRWNRY